MNFIFLKYERSGSRVKLVWRPLGVTYFARDPLGSYFDERQKNEFCFLNKLLEYINILNILHFS